MAKPKNGSKNSVETPQEETAPEEEISQDTSAEEAPSEEASADSSSSDKPAEESTAIEKSPSGPATLAEKLAENNTPLFLATYSDNIAGVMSEMPDKRTANRIIDALPEEYVDKIASIIRRNMGKRKGIYDDDNRPELPELRIYHGTGNDPNRPENMIPGQYYMTTKQTVGKQFIGTLLLVYKGRTMWGDRDAGENTRMPVCQSMDRKVGSSFGFCDSCPNRPWKDGKLQRCSDDVIAYMLSRDLNEIVLVRFAKTSEGAGKQLIRLARRTEANWAKWYSITSEATVNQNDKSQRYFVMKVSPVESENEDDVYVDEQLHDFCDMMCTILDANIVLPGIAHVYRQAKDLLSAPTAASGDVGAGSVGLMPEDPTPDYGDGDMPDAPDTGATNL